MPSTGEGLDHVTFKCIFDEDSKTSNWIPNDSELTLPTEVPNCLYRCLKSPKTEEDNSLTMDWNGQHWSDSFPSFKCKDGMNEKDKCNILNFD